MQLAAGCCRYTREGDPKPKHSTAKRRLCPGLEALLFVEVPCTPLEMCSAPIWIFLHARKRFTPSDPPSFLVMWCKLLGNHPPRHLTGPTLVAGRWRIPCLVCLRSPVQNTSLGSDSSTSGSSFCQIRERRSAATAAAFSGSRKPTIFVDLGVFVPRFPASVSASPRSTAAIAE